MKNFTRRLFGRFYLVSHSDVLSYKGSWRKGAFHGYGVLEYSNGGLYKGDFKSGVKHGFGVYTSASGFRYEGEWSDGEQTGSAKISYKNGDWYEGAVDFNHRDAGLCRPLLMQLSLMQKRFADAVREYLHCSPCRRTDH